MTINKAYLPLYNTDYRYYVLKGGAGSGKSHGIAQKIISDIYTNKSKRWLIIRKTATTLYKSVFLLLRDIIIEAGLYDYFTFNKTEKTIICKHTGSEIYCSGLDDPEKIKSITGITDCWIEEASELLLADFKQLVLRLRGKGLKKHYYLSFNPISEKHWLKKEFFDFPKDDCLIIETTYHDNDFIDDDYKTELESNKETDPYYYQVYVLNKWGNVSTGKIFNNYVVHDFDFETDLVNRSICSGQDFGVNDPNATTFSYVKDRELYIFSEMFIVGIDAIELGSRLRKIKWINRSPLFCDSSGKNEIMILKRSGVVKATPAPKGQNSVLPGIKYLKSFKKIHIHPSCVNTIDEFENYSWKVTKDGIVTETPEDKYNHGIDSLRYAHSIEIRKWAQKRRAS